MARTNDFWTLPLCLHEVRHFYLPCFERFVEAQGEVEKGLWFSNESCLGFRLEETSPFVVFQMSAVN